MLLSAVAAKKTTICKQQQPATTKISTDRALCSLINDVRTSDLVGKCTKSRVLTSQNSEEREYCFAWVLDRYENAIHKFAVLFKIAMGKW
jgi:hypothetical protein